jgi:hypothetical protein
VACHVAQIDVSHNLKFKLPHLPESNTTTPTAAIVGGVLNPLNTELNPICHLLALLGGATIVVVSRLRVNVGCSLCWSFVYS